MPGSRNLLLGAKKHSREQLSGALCQAAKIVFWRRAKTKDNKKKQLPVPLSTRRRNCYQQLLQSSEPVSQLTLGHLLSDSTNAVAAWLRPGGGGSLAMALAAWWRLQWDILSAWQATETNPPTTRGANIISSCHLSRSHISSLALGHSSLPSPTLLSLSPNTRRHRRA